MAGYPGKALTSLICCTWCILLHAHANAEKRGTGQITDFSHSSNPLQKLHSFAFFAYYAPGDGKNYAAIHDVVVKELQKIGRVVQMKQEGLKEAIDVTGFASGSQLNFEIKNISTLNEKKVPAMSAALRLSSSIKIQKTGISCFADAWSASCFIDGTFEKKPEKAVAQSLEKLLGQFAEDYQAANPSEKEKPIFYLYAP